MHSSSHTADLRDAAPGLSPRILGEAKRKKIDTQKVDLVMASLMSVSSLIGEMAPGVHNQARNAYSVCLSFPHLQQLYFETVLRRPKASWGRSTPRYAGYFNAFDVCCKLMDCYPYDPDSVPATRLRVILVMQFFHLFRYVDLARTYRVLLV